jgi:hypothetical protein
MHYFVQLIYANKNENHVIWKLPALKNREILTQEEEAASPDQHLDFPASRQKRGIIIALKWAVGIISSFNQSWKGALAI